MEIKHIYILVGLGVFFLAIGIILIEISGIASYVSEVVVEKSKENQDSIQVQFEDYMKEMYDDPEYKIQGIIYSDYDQSYDIMNAYSPSLDGKFTVRRYEEENGVRYKDTYQSLLIRDEIEEKVQELATSYFSVYKSYADTSEVWFKELGNPDLTLEQAVENGEDLGCNIWIMIPPEVFESKEQFRESVKQFAKAWEETDVRAFFSFYYLSENVFEELNRDNCYDMQGGKDFQDAVRINVNID